MGKSPYFQFCCESKTIFKKKVFIENNVYKKIFFNFNGKKKPLVLSDLALIPLVPTHLTKQVSALIAVKTKQ